MVAARIAAIEVSYGTIGAVDIGFVRPPIFDTL